MFKISTWLSFCERRRLLQIGGSWIPTHFSLHFLVSDCVCQRGERSMYAVKITGTLAKWSCVSRYRCWMISPLSSHRTKWCTYLCIQSEKKKQDHLQSRSCFLWLHRLQACHVSIVLVLPGRTVITVSRKELSHSFHVESQHFPPISLNRIFPCVLWDHSCLRIVLPTTHRSQSSQKWRCFLSFFYFCLEWYL